MLTIPRLVSDHVLDEGWVHPRDKVLSVKSDVLTFVDLLVLEIWVVSRLLKGFLVLGLDRIEQVLKCIKVVRLELIKVLLGQRQQLLKVFFLDLALDLSYLLVGVLVLAILRALLLT